MVGLLELTNMRKCLQRIIISKNNNMNQCDNGVSTLKVCLQTLTVFLTIFIILSCLCVHAAECTKKLVVSACACKATGWQLCTTFQLSIEMWVSCTLTSGFSDALAYSQIKRWRVTGFEAAVTLLATAQCQGPECLSGHGMMPVCAICLSIKKKYVARLSL